MFDKLKEKTGKILICSEDEARSDLIKDTLSEKFGGDYQFCSDLNSAKEEIENGDFDWALVELFAEQETNALQFLTWLTRTPEKKHIRVSLLLANDDRYVLATAFELGLLSYHDLPKDKESFGSSIEDMLKHAEEAENAPTLVSANYIRQILRESDQVQEWVRMEKELLSLYPSSTDLLIHYAEALYKQEKRSESYSILKQLEQIDENMSGRVKALIEGYFPDGSEPETRSEINLLNLKKVIAIDPDSDLLDSMKSSFESLGVSEIFICEDGESAFKIIEEQQDIDLIVTEWKIPALTAPALIQRVRFELELGIPIIIQSSLMKKEDHLLVAELGINHILEKPFAAATFNKTVISTIQSDRSPSKAISLDRKFRNAILTSDIEEAKDLAGQLLNLKDAPEAMKVSVKAQLNYSMGNFNTAKSLALEGIKKTGDSLTLLNILGKALMRLGDHKTAIRCFEKADSIAPGNLDRICAIAESYSTTGNIEMAEIRMDDADQLDSGAKVVKETKAKVAFNKGDTEATKKLMSEVHPMENMIAFMNNKAVALAKNSRTDQSIEEYKKASDSIPDERSDLAAIIKYNLGLAYAREGDLEEAFDVLNEAEALGASKILAKAISLRNRIKDAMEGGTELKMSRRPTKSNDSENASDNDSHEILLNESTASVIKRGDLCCFMIYSNQGAQDPKVAKLLSSETTDKAAS